MAIAQVLKFRNWTADGRHRALVAWRVAVLLLLAYAASTIHSVHTNMVTDAASSWEMTDLARDVEHLSASVSEVQDAVRFCRR